MNLDTIARAMEAESGTYTGGPIQLFEKVGRNTFITLLREGLLPDSRVLDYGAGSLRLAFWIMRFVDPGCYYAIEPVQKTIDVGLKYLFDADLLERKRPHIHVSGKCDMTFFGQQFDFVVARSIFTHTTPGMLAKSLGEFAICAAPGAKLLASYWPVDRCSLEGFTGDSMPADDWRFIQVVKYSLSYMQDIAARHGLRVEEIHTEDETLNQQVWLRFTRP